MIIDVSKHNKRIDWEQVKPHIEKAIIRLGYGNDSTTQDDSCFEYNLAECKRLGIRYEFYIYSYARTISEAKSEAAHALRLMGTDRYTVYWDSEENGTGETAVMCWEAFRDEIKAAGGTVGLYASESWYKNYLQTAKGYDRLWIAKYGENSGKPGKKPDVQCDLWQYTSKGSVPGIDGPVDISLAFNKVSDNPVGFEEVGAVYRLYNPNAGDHFFTISAFERDVLVRAGWLDEGTAWTAPEKSDNPVYRAYNPNAGAGAHHFTTNRGEMDVIISAGWEDEGIAFYSGGDRPVFRLYNQNSGEHFFTASDGERMMLIGAGWTDEGIGFYAV